MTNDLLKSIQDFLIENEDIPETFFISPREKWEFNGRKFVVIERYATEDIEALTDEDAKSLLALEIDFVQPNTIQTDYVTGIASKAARDMMMRWASPVNASIRSIQISTSSEKNIFGIKLTIFFNTYIRN